MFQKQFGQLQEFGGDVHHDGYFRVLLAAWAGYRRRWSRIGLALRRAVPHVNPLLFKNNLDLYVGRLGRVLPMAGPRWEGECARGGPPT